MVTTISTKFYDTNSIILLWDTLFTEGEKIYLSSITLFELEHIKVSNSKSEDIRYRARKAIHELNSNPNLYEVVVYDDAIKEILSLSRLDETPDNKICACAKYLDYRFGDVIFYTYDLCCRTIARDVFGLNTYYIEVNLSDEYKGYKEVVMSDEDMAYFYENLQNNMYDLYINEYLIVKNENGEVVDKLRWDGNEYQNMKFENIKSTWFGTVKPYDGDVYQQCALNSMTYNQITMIKGPAGTGKSYLALGYLFNKLEKHKIDKIIIFCNTVATANSAKIGFLPGTQTEKLLDSSVGNMLAGKLGDKIAVERLISDGKLMLLPMCDIRGFDTTGMNAGIYITEAQNMDISLMQLALQRIGEDSICIIDGDYNAQVDLTSYAGKNNGMRRMSEVFRGQDFYGEVELKNIYRSRIAKLAQEM